jgi:hypothetical protein
MLMAHRFPASAGLVRLNLFPVASGDLVQEAVHPPAASRRQNWQLSLRLFSSLLQLVVGPLMMKGPMTTQRDPVATDPVAMDQVLMPVWVAMKRDSA